MDVDTRLLRYFAAVADEGNLTRAAQRLFVSQPALTKQIRQLEAQLGVTLVTRSRAGMALTDAGRVLPKAPWPVIFDPAEVSLRGGQVAQEQPRPGRKISGRSQCAGVDRSRSKASSRIRSASSQRPRLARSPAAG
jgi:Bacterial regulatory helix-turn-helix protein, lysR family